MVDVAETDPTENGIIEIQPENFAQMNPEEERTFDHLDIQILAITMQEIFSGKWIEELTG